MIQNKVYKEGVDPKSQQIALNEEKLKKLEEKSN